MTGTEALIAAMVLTGASTAMQMAGSIQQGNAQAAAANRTAEIARQDRIRAINTADLAAQDQRREHQRTLGAIRASMGSSGLEMAGSPLDVLADSSQEMALDQRRTAYEGQVQGRDYANRINATVAEGKNSRTAGYLGAGTALLSGASKATGQYASYKGYA